VLGRYLFDLFNHHWFWAFGKKNQNQRMVSSQYMENNQNQKTTSSGYLEKIKIKEPPVLVFHKSRRNIGFQMHLFTHSQALHGPVNSNVLSKLPCSCTDWSENSMSMHCVELGTEAWVRAMFVHCLAQKVE
jgi:hypothetical protein